MPISGPPLDNPICLPELLRHGLETKPDVPALVSAERSWTWRELDQVTDRLATNLLGLGLRPGDRVASLMPNRIELLAHYIACIKAHLVATPLNYRYMAPEIDHALGISEASVLVAHTEREADLAKSDVARRLPLGVIRYGASDNRNVRFENLLDHDAPFLSAAGFPLSDPAFIFFTSGSTGSPKGVVHTYESMGWCLASTIRGFEFTANDVILPGSSISHLGGFLFSMCGLAAGARVDLARTFDGDELLPLLRKTRPTVLCMLPAALFCLVRDHDAKREDFSSVRLCRAGGDKVSAELEREFTALAGFPIDEGYGMTEIGLATLNPPSGVMKLGSVGQLNPGYTASVRDGSGVELSRGKEGRLWIKSPTATIGYWNNTDATDNTIRGGWLDTGDVMQIDSDGYFWFCGRKKQIIVHDGSNICPQEVEEALLEHAAVADAGVVGVHDLVHGENVRAYVALKEDFASVTSQELIRFARDRVGYKAPEEIVVLNEMPMNATGKVDRVTLKRLAENQHEPQKDDPGYFPV